MKQFARGFCDTLAGFCLVGWIPAAPFFGEALGIVWLASAPFAAVAMYAAADAMRD